MLSFSRRIIVLFLSCVLFEGTIAHSGHDEHSIGEIELVDGKRKALPPLRELERKATTAVELTCLRAFRENMGSPEEVIIQTGDSGQGINWCEALDETPFVADPNKYFVLIRMKLYYVKDFRLSPTKDRNLYFIIIASRTLDDEFNEMEIVNILPRIPCVATHTEEISNIQVFEKENYFTTTTSTGERIPGCFDRSWGKYHFHTYVDRITFTGRESNHLFLYGSRLIQSNDAGRTYILLRTLTAPIDPRQKPDPYDTLTLHQITVMAFDSEGHYAFLTNANELWFGSTGDTRQIILRGIKSDGGHSMMQTMVTSFNASFPYASPTIDHLYIEAQPVGLFFDDQDVLYEIVVLWNWVEGEEMITTRRIPVDMMMRYNKFYLDLLLLSAGHVKANKSTYHFVYDVKRFSAYCPMSSVKFYENFIVEGSVNAQTDAKPQIESDSDSANNDHPAKWTINIATTHLVWKGVDKLVSSGYETSSLNPERFDRWILKKQEFATVAQLRFITAEKLSSKSNGNRLLKEYYIDYGSTLRLELYYSTNTDAVVGVRDFTKQRMRLIQLNVENPNGTLLQVDTEKIRLIELGAVKFVVDISVIRNPLLAQNRPGENLIGYHLIFHLIGGFPTCGKRLSDPFASSAQSTVLRVGCRPSTSILFNWNETLYSIQFKDQDAHYGRGDECYDNEFVCFFARAPLVFHFDIYDIAKQTYVPYTGNYVMRIIAGGYEKDKMDNYTLEQQEGYNIPGTSDVSLIWNEWDLVASQKIDRPPPHFDADSTSEEDNIKKTHRERVLQAGVSAIQWACHTLSPCARVVPNAAFQTVFWFRISISNRGVEKNTLCLYEKEFDIMLYGFPPSPETQLFTTIIFCLCMLGILYLLFICLRGHKRVWRATKLKMSGWYLIIRDTFPKVLKTHEEQGQEENLTQLQKDNIILSLQGHLKIPPLIARDSATAVQFAPDARDSVLSGASRTSSLTSMMSITSLDQQSQADGIDKAAAPPAPTNWTDLVYEQIISKRLAAIVDKNRKMRANILRRASMHDTSIEHEKRYEQEHKKTVDEESMFTLKKE